MIKSIELLNFKCFVKQRFELAPLTVLAGINGVGKSTLIQSLLVLRQSYKERTGNSLQAIVLNGQFGTLGSFKDVLCEDATSDDVEIGIETSTATERLKFYNDFGNLRNSISDSHQLFSESLFGDRFHYVAADRHGPGMYFRTSIQDVIRHGQIGVRGEFAPHFLSVYGSSYEVSETMRLSEADGPNLLQQLEAWMSQVSPGVRLHVAEQSAAIGLDIVTLRYSYVFQKDVSNQFRSENVGFGVTYSLAVFVAILASKAGDLVIIENPEAHLHPRGQFMIGKLLALAANTGIQLIVETHSDHILNGVRVAMKEKKISKGDVVFFFFNRENATSTRPTVHKLIPDGDGRFAEWPAGFFDEWDKALGKLI